MYNAATLKHVAPNLMESTELVALDDLQENPLNPKLHPKSQITELVRSIKAFRFNDPIVTNDDLMILEGHGRLLAARQLKMSHVPVIRLSHMSEEQQAAYLVAHNKLNSMTDVDIDKLKAFEAPLKVFDFIGLTEQEVALFNRIAPAPTPEPAIAGVEDDEEVQDDDAPPYEPVPEPAEKKRHECPSCGYEW